MTSGGPLGGDGEFDVLRQVFKIVKGTGGLPVSEAVVIGPGDDAAVLAGGWVVSTDQMVEGIHFGSGWVSDTEVGGRAVRAALSDLAAMAAEPVGVLASIAIDPQDASTRITDIMRGAAESAAVFGAQVLGGDLSRMPEGGPLVVDMVALGRAPRPLLRSGATAGDELWVTGPLGGAAAAVDAWKKGGEPPPSARSAFVQPLPRTREIGWLSERVDLRAGIDLSDGLLADAGHMSAASGVRLVIDTGSVPRHPVLRGLSNADSDGLALSGGEDYEMLVSVSSGALAQTVGLYERTFGTSLVQVGNVREGAGVAIRTGDGEVSVVDSRTGYNHFR